MPAYLSVKRVQQLVIFATVAASLWAEEATTIDTLRQRLRSGDERARIAVLQELIKRPDKVPDAGASTPEVLALARSSNTEMRQAAIAALVNLEGAARVAEQQGRPWTSYPRGSPDTKIVLLTALEDSNAVLRNLGVNGYAAIFGTTVELERILVARFPLEPESHVRKSIVNHLNQTAHISAASEAVFIKALKDPSCAVRYYAVRGIARTKPKASLPDVIAGLNEEDRGTRAEYAKAVRAYGPEAIGYLPLIEQALRREKEQIVRRELVSAVEAIKRP